ncbi:conserved domain protein [Enterococcus faecium PC4.1]|nr:conserved domain protein [Enterococcus faecium PC4.1]
MSKLGFQKKLDKKMNKTFIETKEYKRFAEFCDACIKYKYIGICYGAPGVGKTLSSRYYCNWDNIEKQIA